MASGVQHFIIKAVEMHKKMIEVLRCPQTSQQLVLEQPVYRDEQIYSGFLVSENGQCRYPIRDFIPRFVTSENYTDSFGYQWNIHRKTQLDSFTGLPISRNRLLSVSGWSNNLKGELILEAGSGAGRFTEVLLQTDANLFSFDYSSAVDANRINNGDKPNLQLFQGNIYELPFSAESFDKVICLGVLQHTPDPEQAFKNLAKYVKPGGEIVMDIYTLSLTSWLQWKYLFAATDKTNEQGNPL